MRASTARLRKGGREEKEGLEGLEGRRGREGDAVQHRAEGSTDFARERNAVFGQELS